jgi:hypothetical protein
MVKMAYRTRRMGNNHGNISKVTGILESARASAVFTRVLEGHMMDKPVGNTP